jgi:hypothetical protein
VGLPQGRGVIYIDAGENVPERRPGLRPSEKNFRDSVPARSVTKIPLPRIIQASIVKIKFLLSAVSIFFLSFLYTGVFTPVR